jgi:Cu/Ag efflux protein CusF
MRILVTAVAAIALLGAVSIAFAADATGKIKNVDMNKDMIKLDNGSSYIVPKSVKLSDFKVGEKVTVIYNKTGNKFDVTSIRPATRIAGPRRCRGLCRRAGNERHAGCDSRRCR